MARRKPKHRRNQPSLFGPDPSPAGKEVNHGSQAEDDRPGVVASDQHADRDTVGPPDSGPAGTATATTVAQSPGGSLHLREDPCIKEPDDAPREPVQVAEETGSETAFELSGGQDGQPDRPRGKAVRGISPEQAEGIQRDQRRDDSMEFHRKLHGFTVDQWAILQERTRQRKERETKENGR